MPFGSRQDIWAEGGWPRPQGAPRDFRIDFFRGLALCMIVVDHIAINPLAKLTYQRFGFSDAAEIFVFLSGVSCGIAYYPYLMERGAVALIKSLIKRAGLIYVFYAAASLATILVVACSANLLVHSSIVGRCFAGCVDSVLGASLSAVLLGAQPPFPGILVLYVPLTLWTAPMLFAGEQWGLPLALSVSGSIWAATQLHKPAYGQIYLFPYFNPIAWQFLFTIGLCIGVRYRKPARSTWVPPHWLIALAAAIVMVALLAKLPSAIADRISADRCWFHCGADFAQDKYNLSPLRLAHFLSVALLVSRAVHPNSAFLHWGRGLLIKTGQCSLPVFSVGAVLSVIFSIVFAVFSPSPVERIALNLIPLALTALAALLLVRRFKGRGRLG